jgi:hypothetical protein
LNFGISAEMFQFICFTIRVAIKYGMLRKLNVSTIFIDHGGQYIFFLEDQDEIVLAHSKIQIWNAQI